MLEFYTANGPKLLLDETSVMDIGSCFVDGVDVAPGAAVPDDGDARISHSVQGFLFTCGPDHIRHPELIEGGDGRKYPLHGSFSASPAEVTLFELGDDEARAEANVSVELAGGGAALLRRSWRMDDATGTVSLRDVVMNVGETPFVPMFMYHMNIGARLFDDGVMLSGDMFQPGTQPWTFGEGDGHVFCVPAGGDDAEVRLGPLSAVGSRTLAVSFDTSTLPYLQMWRNQQRPAHVLGIEPVSHDWKPRRDLAAEGKMDLMQPGETRSYGLKFRFLR